MAEEGSKQAAISSDEGVNQEAFALSRSPIKDTGIPLYPEHAIKSGLIAEDVNSGISSRFSDPVSPSYSIPRIDQTKSDILSGMRHPSQGRTETGAVISTPMARERAHLLFTLAKLKPHLDSGAMSSAGAYATGERGMLTLEELQEAHDPTALEYIGLAFEPFDAPRRAVWGAAAYLGQYLPDPGSLAGDAIQSVVGVVGGLALGTSVGLTEGVWTLGLGATVGAIASLWDDDENEESPSSPIVPGQEAVDGFMEMVENLYDAVATGELYETSKTRIRPNLYADWSRTGIVTGDMLIDAMLTKGQAWELSQDATKAPHLRAFARHVSTDVGRLSYGLLAEFIVDPLWIWGPGKAGSFASRVRYGDDIFHLLGPAAKGASSVQNVARAKRGADALMFNKIVANMVRSTDPKVVESSTAAVAHYGKIAAAQVVDSRNNLEAIAKALQDGGDLGKAVRSQSQRVFDQAEVLSKELIIEGKEGQAARILEIAKQKKILADSIQDAAGQARWLKQQSRMIANEIKTFEKHADNISLSIRAAADARQAGDLSKLVKQKGFLSYHMPFTTKFGYVFKSGPLDNATALLRASPIASKFIDDFSLTGLQAKVDEAAIGLKGDERVPTASEVFAGDPAALLAYQTQRIVQWPAHWAGAFFTGVAATIGSRMIQPITETMSVARYQKQGLVRGIPYLGNKMLIKIQKVNPELWEKQQANITDYLNSFTGLDMKLTTELERLGKKAQEALKIRRKISVKEGARLQRLISTTSDQAEKAELQARLERVMAWNNKKEYSEQDIMLEALDALDRGAKRWHSLSDEVLEVMEELKALRDAFAADPAVAGAKIKFEQGMVSMARFAKGDIDHKAKLLSMLEVINAQMSNVSTFRDLSRSRTHQAILKRVTQLRSLEEGVAGLGVDVLARALEEVKVLKDSGIVDEAIYAEHMLEHLTKVTGTATSARRVLRQFALALGETDGTLALRKLFERLGGSLEFAEGAKLKKNFNSAMTHAINKYLATLKEEHRMLDSAYKKGLVLSEGTKLKVGEKNFYSGMTRKEFRSLLKEMIRDNDETWKVLVPEHERELFETWVTGVEPPSVKARKAREKTYSSRPADWFDGKVVTDKVKVTVNNGIINRVIREQVEASKDGLVSLKDLIRSIPKLDEFENNGYVSLLNILSEKVGKDVRIGWLEDSKLVGEYRPKQVVEGVKQPRRVLISDNAPDALQALAHETLHAVTVNRYRNAAKAWQKGEKTASSHASDNLRKLFNYVVDRAKNDPELLLKHGIVQGQPLRDFLASPEEFISYGVSSPEFARFLDSIPYLASKRTSVFDVFWGKVKKLFGLRRKDTAYRELNLIVSELLTAKDSIVRGRKPKGFPMADSAKRFEKPPSVERRGVFDFEPHEKAHWNQARSYYDRVGVLKGVSRKTYRTAKDTTAKRHEVIGPAATFAEHEGYRLSDVLTGRGIKIHKRFQLDKDHGWYLVTPRPAKKLNPAKVRADKADELEEIIEPVEPVKPVRGRRVKFKGEEAAPVKPTKKAKHASTETAQVSHDVDPVVPTETKGRRVKLKPGKPKTGVYQHRRGELSKKGFFRSSYRLDETYKVEKVKEEWVVRRFNEDKSLSSVEGSPESFSTRGEAARWLKRFDDERGLPEWKPVTVKWDRVRVPGLKQMRLSFTDPNGNGLFYLSMTDPYSPTKRVINIIGPEGVVDTIKPSKNPKTGKVTPATKGRAAEALKEHLDNIEGNVPDTPAVSKLKKKLVEEAEEQGIIGSDPPIVERMSQPRAGNYDIDELLDTGYKQLTPGTKLKKDDVVAIFDGNSASPDDMWRVESAFQTMDGQEIGLVARNGKTTRTLETDELDDIQVYFKRDEAKTKTKPKQPKVKKGRGKVKFKEAVEEAPEVTRGALEDVFPEEYMGMVDDAKRIKRSGGAAIYPTYKALKDEWLEVIKPLMPKATKKELNARLKVELTKSGIETKAKWLAYRSKSIDEIVEEPVKHLVKKVLDEGHRPTYSNAYNAGEKGVWFTRSDGSEGFYRLSDNELKALFKEAPEKATTRTSRIKFKDKKAPKKPQPGPDLQPSTDIDRIFIEPAVAKEVNLYPEVVKSGAEVKRLGWYPFVQRKGTVDPLRQLEIGTEFSVWSQGEKRNQLVLQAGGVLVDSRKAKDSDELVFFFERNGLGFDVRESELRLFQAGDPSSTMHGAGKKVFFKTPLTKVAKTDPVKIPDTFDAALAGDFTDGVVAGKLRPITVDSAIAVYQDGKLVDGGRITSQHGGDFKLDTGRSINEKVFIKILRGKHEDKNVQALVLRPNKTRQAQRNKAALMDDLEEQLIEYYEPELAPLTRPKGAPKRRQGKIAESDLRLTNLQKSIDKIDGEMGNLRSWVWAYTKDTLKVADPKTVADEVVDLFWGAREVLEKLKDYKITAQKFNANDIELMVDYLHNLRRLMGGLDAPDTGVSTVLRELMRSEAFKRKLYEVADSSKILMSTSRRIDSILPRLKGLTPFHKDMHNTLSGLLKFDEKAVEGALRSLETGFKSGSRSKFPDVGSYAMASTAASRQQLTEAGFRAFRLRRALKDMSDDEVAATLAKIVSKNKDVDPIVFSVLKKAFGREAKKIKAVFGSPDLSLAKLDKEMEIIKKSVSEYIVPPKIPKRVPKKARGKAPKEESGLESLQKDLKKELSKTKAKLPKLEEGAYSGRDLENWETKMMAEFNHLTKDLSEEDTLLAVMGVLKEAPMFVNKETHPALAKLYPGLIGRRYTPVDPVLKPVMDEAHAIIKRYEAEYAERGYTWAASPERIMRDWGVIEFTPHIYKEIDKNILYEIHRGRVRAAGSAGGLDNALMTTMEASHRRKLSGSILELKALKNTGHDKILTADPLEIYARYCQANRAMTNEDLLVTMMDTGTAQVLSAQRAADGSIVKTIEQVAADGDWVPVFNMSNIQRDVNVMHRGNLEQWLASGMTPEDVASYFKNRGKEMIGGVMTDTLFASFIKSSPRMRYLRKTEQTVVRIRAAQAAAGEELFDPIAVYSRRIEEQMDEAGRVWDRTRKSEVPPDDLKFVRFEELRDTRSALGKKIFEDLADEANTLRQKYATDAPRLEWDHLKYYFDQDTRFWQTYIKRAFKVNMEEVLDMGSIGKLAGSAPVQYLRAAQAFWKTRVTVTSVAFSTRNAISNTVSNILDLGIKGALSPFNLILGGQLSLGLMIKERYGSIEKYFHLIDTGDDAFRAAQKHITKFSGLRKLHENGIDFRNGIIRPLDDVLDDFVETNVVSPSFVSFSDITKAETDLLEQMASGNGVAQLLGKKMGGVDLEDVALFGMTFAVSGFPVALPKNWGGKYLARTVENQARITNFLGNYRRTGQWADSVNHVHKFLFNYGDLTNTQKQVMRLIFPWFTWNIKNVHLQWNMMQKSPHFYATFHRMMTDGVPQIFEATQSQAEGRGYVKSDPLDMETLRLRETHYMHTIGVPLPTLEGTPFENIPVPYLDRKDKGEFFKMGKLGKNWFPLLKHAKLQGLGLPQEAFMNQVSLLSGLVDPQNWGVGMLLPDEFLKPIGLSGKTARARQYSDRARQSRLLGEVHFLARVAVEQMTKRHSFYGKEISELNDGRLVSEILRPLDAIPLVGAPMKAYLADRAGLKQYTYYDKFNKQWRTKIHIDGQMNYLLGQLPWMRNFRDAAAATEMFYASRTVPTETLLADGVQVSDLREIPYAASLADALSGINIKQLDPELMAAYAQYRLDKLRRKQLRSLGIIKDFSQSYVPYR